MIKAVFFDINDTLTNHSRAQEVAIKKMAVFLSKHDETEFIKVWKETAKKYWELFEKRKITFEEQRLQRVESVWNHFKAKLTPEQINQYANYYVSYYEQVLSINPTLKVFLELLQTNHIPAGIISNGHGHIQRRRLKVIGIEPHLTNRLVFISEEIGIAKPDEKIFIQAEKAVGVSSSDILFFGDDLKNDIEPAKKRGWRTVLITPP
ncbi:HAD family hydrolase [Candidatus Daviesbacteria bacterium]|nr:HAD family hydrolase [Candidatus Daviesbacteria bacterium]